MRLDELIESLQAYEMNQKSELKEEDMALKLEARRQKKWQQGDVDEDEDREEDEIESLSRKLHNIFRKYKITGKIFRKKIS